MRIVTETRYCDGCGVGPNRNATNVPYLGWVSIVTYPDGVPLAKPLMADLCSACAHRVWALIPVGGSDGAL